MCDVCWVLRVACCVLRVVCWMLGVGCWGCVLRMNVTRKHCCEALYVYDLCSGLWEGGSGSVGVFISPVVAQ